MWGWNWTKLLMHSRRRADWVSIHPHLPNARQSNRYRVDNRVYHHQHHHPDECQSLMSTVVDSSSSSCRRWCERLHPLAVDTCDNSTASDWAMSRTCLSSVGGVWYLMMSTYDLRWVEGKGVGEAK